MGRTRTFSAQINTKELFFVVDFRLITSRRAKSAVPELCRTQSAAVAPPPEKSKMIDESGTSAKSTPRNQSPTPRAL